MTHSFDFRGKVVLITGSSSGIGARTALKFSEAGAQLVITGLAITAVDLTVAANKCWHISPKNLKPLELFADLSKEENCKQLIEYIIVEFGKLDILVNCAGIVIPAQVNDKDYIHKYKRSFETNLNSVIYLTHYSIEHLEKAKGNIINISSVAAVMTHPLLSSYCMSKCAIDLCTKCMAVELGPKGTRVNSILPGVIRTTIGENLGFEKILINEIFERCAQLYPVGIAGNVDDITSAIMYLASNESLFMTGINFVVDGGHMAGNVNI